MARGGTEMSVVLEPVPTDEIIELSMWLKVSDPVVQGMGMRFFYRDGSESNSVFPDPDPPIATQEWGFFDVTETLHPGKDLVEIRVGGFASLITPEEDRTWVDDFTLRVVPEPSTLALLLVGFAFFVRTVMQGSLQPPVR